MKADTNADAHTPSVVVRMQPALRTQLEEFGKQTGIGNLSAVIRFACVSFLRTESARLPQPTVTPARKAS